MRKIFKGIQIIGSWIEKVVQFLLMSITYLAVVFPMGLILKRKLKKRKVSEKTFFDSPNSYRDDHFSEPF